MRKEELDYVLHTMLDSREKISDLNFTVGKMPQVESNGQLLPVTFDPPIGILTPYQTEQIALALINRDKRLTDLLIKEGSCDLSYSLKDKARFRVNIFSQKGVYSIVLRKLENEIRSINDLGLPGVLYNIASEKNGFVLLCGATGTGKTTTLSAILNEINEKQSVHVVTLEDPVEFVHSQKRATFNQRELGVDFASFSTGLRAALRQAVKVILVGEMRDRETMEIGLTAAETGHLVLSTLHTIDAGQTISRIVGMFEKEEQHNIRIRLADSIRWLVCQRLIPKVGGGRIPILEIMQSNLRIKNLILNGETEDKTIYNIIETGEAFGMQTFDKHLVSLFDQEIITEEVAVAYASKRPVVKRGIDTVKSTKGIKTTEIKGLSMNKSYRPL
ncbi:MAG: type IV pilus twitching motility protein PilT [bacterium]